MAGRWRPKGASLGPYARWGTTNRDAIGFRRSCGGISGEAIGAMRSWRCRSIYPNPSAHEDPGGNCIHQESTAWNHGLRIVARGRTPSQHPNRD